MLIIFCSWYFGKIKRIEAEKKLLMPQNEHGAFLIRDSESRRNDFSLSVRDGDTVKHYRIRQLDEGGFFIARRTTFRTLQELVDHYSRDADGLCVNLRKPCVQVNISGFQMWWKNTFWLFLVLQLIKDVLFEVMFIVRSKIGNWPFKTESIFMHWYDSWRCFLKLMSL